MPAARASNSGAIAVVGLWHLGSVTAACLATAGCRVIGIDPDPNVVERLAAGVPPVAEPGLSDLLAEANDRLSYTSDPAGAAEAARAWVTFDTPVDDEDKADVEWVLANAAESLAALPADALVIVSSQLPVGSIARLRERCRDLRDGEELRFACIPENLRLGNALEAFRAPDRFVAGVRSERDRAEVAELLAPFDARIEWMGVESAEMTKHALNGFLATSIAFINEIAAVCEVVGADASEVSRGLKSERRIGPRAYLAPGDAFAGGTLARDIGFLRGLATAHGLADDVFAGVANGNVAHKNWSRRKLLELVGGRNGGERPLAGATIAIWGLTYKPGTDTLRRSSAVELCRWLLTQGASVRAHDPMVGELPSELAGGVTLCETPLTATDDAAALVVCTAWPEYRDVDVRELRASLRTPLVIDPASFLADTAGAEPGLRYVRVGSTEAVAEPARELEATE